MQSTIRALTRQQRKALLQALIERYEKSPETIEKTLPEVAEIFATLGHIPKKTKYGGLSQLTPVEKEKREHSLQKALDKMNRVKELSREEAIQTLEDAAALVEAFPFDELPISDTQIGKLVKTATGLSVSKRGKPQKCVLQEGEPARTVYLLRGIQLNLSWDKKLMSVEIDPKELAVMKKALSIIGIGRDTATDVSLRHDDYLLEAYSEQ